LVCVQQIYNEALGEFGKPRNSVAREIGQIMNGTIVGWKPYPNPRNIPKYGKQRGWMRVETNSGNTEETFTPVEGIQMEIPFD
ncbi:MAG: virulence-associated protein E, partial [Pseudobutyrivibrio sp.]|nr:virulence-associated protein E [Pseudobutyrivibrio sp.]